MKEFIDKLISRLGKESDEWLERFMADSKKGHCNDYADGSNDAFNEAISIVNELAEEYKVSEMPTGWIPCSERLPSVNGWYLVTNTLGIVQQQYWGANHWHKLNDEFVVAWCELPAPYTEGE